jgi:hypothetical protein
MSRADQTAADRRELLVVAGADTMPAERFSAAAVRSTVGSIREMETMAKICVGETKKDSSTTALLGHAAQLLEQEAEGLRQSHTVRGKWPNADAADLVAKEAYENMVETARGLRAVASKGLERRLRMAR